MRPYIHDHTVLRSSLMVDHTGAYSGFRTMKWLGVFFLHPGWSASPSQGYSLLPIKKSGRSRKLNWQFQGLRNHSTLILTETNWIKNLTDKDFLAFDNKSAIGIKLDLGALLLFLSWNDCATYTWQRSKVCFSHESKYMESLRTYRKGYPVDVE